MDADERLLFLWHEAEAARLLRLSHRLELRVMRRAATLAGEGAPS